MHNKIISVKVVQGYNFLKFLRHNKPLIFIFKSHIHAILDAADLSTQTLVLNIIVDLSQTVSPRYLYVFH